MAIKASKKSDFINKRLKTRTSTPPSTRILICFTFKLYKKIRDMIYLHAKQSLSEILTGSVFNCLLEVETFTTKERKK